MMASSFEPYLQQVQAILRASDRWRAEYGPVPDTAIPLDSEKMQAVLSGLEERLRGNYPFHHPQYAGQMLKPPHPIAWAAYIVAMAINPNNHALDGGPPTSAMEKEVIGRLAEMVGFGPGALGHLTSGGTIANLEALFVARESHPGKAIAASSNAHYTHRRMSHLLNVPFIEIPAASEGWDMDALNEQAEAIGTLVVTLGTTGLGTVEPLADLVAWARERGIRIHVDAAYGGFFKLIADRLPHARHWHAMAEADSVVIDPHKHGLQPYGCGAVLFRDASVGRFYQHDSPYTYFTSDELHLGEISLECSRAGASAAALWATLQLLPLTPDGLGAYLQQTVDAAADLHTRLSESPQFDVIHPPELDILAYFPVPDQPTTSAVSRLSRALFQSGMEDREGGFHLSLYTMSSDDFTDLVGEYEADTDRVTLLRSVLMKPEHKPFVPELVKRLHTHLDTIVSDS